MNFYKARRTPSKGAILSAIVLSATVLFGLVCSTSASFQQAQALRIINVGTEATATILGASTSQHLSGNGTSGTFDVNLTNIRAHAIATGDVNGDNIPDVVVGAPDATFTLTPPGGSAQTRTGAGVAYIVFGRSPLAGALDTNAGDANVTILGSKTGDRLGFSVTVGDVNGDGKDDIIIGAPGADFPGSASPVVAARNDTGAAFVIFGAASLSTTPTIDLATVNAASVALFGVNTGDQFGASVAVGNVGGLSAQTPADQAVKDILVGAPGNDGPDGSARPSAGAAYLKFGGPILNPVGGATTVLDLAATPANVVIFGKTGDLLGSSVAIGDINGGGIADIVVGAPLSDRPAAGAVPAGTDTGAVYGVVGGNNLTPAIGTSKTFDVNVTQQNLSVYGAGNKLSPGSDDADHLGFSVAAGDVTGDGTVDLLVGAPDADGPTENRTSGGEAYVIQGGTALDPPSGASERRIDLFSTNPTLTVFGSQLGDRYGSTVVAGSYNTSDNTDSIPDFMVGAPGAISRAGLVSIVFGGPNLLLQSFLDLALGQDNLRIHGQSLGNNDVSGKQLIIRQTLTTKDQSLTPFLQQLSVGINGDAPVVSDDTQAQFATGTLSGAVAANTVITGDATAAGDLELAPNPSLDLNGSTGFMTVANSASLKPGAGSWTLEFWIKRTGAGTGDFQQVIGSRPGPSGNDKGWSVALASASSFKVAAHFADGTTGFDLPAAQSSTGIADSIWQHWAVVFDRAQNRVVFYRNGAVDATVNITFPTGAVDQMDPILIGKDAASAKFLQANLDDIRVWNVARTAQQIQDNFNSMLLGTETGLAAYWNFNGGNANDLTTNANNGTLSGGASVINPTGRLFLTGTRVRSFTFPAATIASSSLISWVQTTPGGTAVKVETSLDNGATFQTAVNGSGIPSISIGDELGWAIGTADINNNQGGELIVGGPFANAAAAAGSRTQAGVVYILPSTSTPLPVNSPPTVTVTAPNGAEALQVGQVFNITWTASDPNGDATIQKFDIQLSTNGGTSFNFTVASNLVGTARNFNWTVPVGFNTTQGRIRVIVTDNQSATAQDDSNANFTITDIGVSATVTSPNGGESLRFGQAVTITWSVPAAVSAQVKGFDLTLSTDGGLTFPIQIAPSNDPAQPALAAGLRSFPWIVPSFCTTKARIAIVTTSITNLRTSDISDADFAITDVGPTVNTTNMFLVDNFRVILVTTIPAGGSEVLFSTDTVIEISNDAAGTAFFTFSKSPKIKRQGGKLLSKGIINGQDLGTFFPNGATRVIRLTRPPCRITVLKVTRNGEDLVLAPAEVLDSQLLLQQRVWQ
ncbi:MAG: LamG-like jellyroll fold domain-containing protein [Blastocatellia bacterium]